MKITELKNNVAVQIDDFDIRDITPENAKKINDITKDRTIVVIKRQDRTPANFVKFVKHLGPIANWTQFNFDPITGEEKYVPDPEKGLIDPDEWPNPNTYPVQRVSQKKVDGKRTGIFATGILDWHANLNGLTRADGVALQGWTHCEQTSTTWLNTAKVYNDMPKDLLERCKNTFAEYEYSPEIWAPDLDPERHKLMQTKREGIGNGSEPYRMWLVQKNIAGKTGIYFYTNNKCKIITDDQKLYNDLYDFMFQDRYMYQHFYEIGDIVLSDQVLSLHKRDQNDPKLLEERVLHRITYRLSNIGKLPWVAEYNKGCTSEKV
tara:strand:- start:5280 stop:6239 length:960 start_codon:yes stop_codon:yes gene_type:complete